MDANPNVRGPHNTPCQHCGVVHGLLCPWVAASEYYPDGSLKRVEYRVPVAPTVTQEQIDRTRRSTDWRENSDAFRWTPETHTYDFVGDPKPGGVTWARGD